MSSLAWVVAVPVVAYGVAMVVRAFKGGPIIAVEKKGGSDEWQRAGTTSAGEPARQEGDKIVKMPGGTIAWLDRYGKIKKEYAAGDPKAPQVK